MEHTRAHEWEGVACMRCGFKQCVKCLGSDCLACRSIPLHTLAGGKERRN